MIGRGYQQIIDLFPGGMVLVDGKGRIVLVNKLVEVVFGYKREELISQNITQLIPFYLKFESTPTVKTLDLNGVRKDASELPLQIRLNLMEIEGEMYSLVSIIDNEKIKGVRIAYDQLQKTRGELEDSREFLNRIINNIASPIFVKDKDHRWILLNDAYCKFMGYEREALIGKSDVDFFPSQEAKVFWQKDQLVFDSGRININEEEFTDASGQCHIIVTKKVLFVQENGDKVLVGIINDITDLKNNERRILDLNAELQDFNTKLKNAYDQLKDAQDKLLRLERLAALGEMAAMVGHELRNSLGVIRNSVYYLKLKLPQYIQEQKVLQYLDTLEEEVRISDRVISDILTFNRIKQPVLQKDNVNVIIRGEFEKIKFPDIVQKGLILDESLPDIEVDADQLRLVFKNIVGNALEAMPQGGQLTVKTFLMGPWIVIKFIDTGTGVLQDNLSRMFKPGFTTKQHGSGLGLAICMGILVMHNGKIEAKSRPGEGTEIIVYLPCPSMGK